jgi:glycine oxidase
LKTDILIIGQGLAGSCLAWRLFQQGISFKVIDQPLLSSSSRVAAGMMNPLVFRYLTLSWRAVQNMDSSKDFYQKMENAFQTKFLHEITIAKIFSETDAELWARKGLNAGIENFTDGKSYYPFSHNEVNYYFGAGIVNKAGWVDTAKLVQKVRELLLKYAMLTEEVFDRENLVIEEKEIHYKDITAKKIIFCEGFRVSENPLFSFIPFRPVKGELLTVRIKGFETNVVLNKDIFLLPLGNEIFRLGSTYDWNDLTEKPTESAKNYLLEKLEAILDFPIEILSHEAGIRPAIADRRPVAGRHPSFSNVFILNGLGAKGVMLAPYVTEQLLNLLNKNIAVDPEIDPSRFVRK